MATELPSAASPAEVLAECRKICVRTLRYQLPSLLREVAQRVESDLAAGKLASRAGPALLKGRAEAFAQRVLEELEVELEHAAEGFVAAASKGFSGPASEKPLPGVSSFEKELVLGRVSSRLTDVNESDYPQIGWRLANLAGSRAVPPAHQPFRPSLFLLAYMRALLAYRILPDELLLISAAAEMPFTQPLRDVYRDLNLALDRLGVPLMRNAASAPAARETSRRADATLAGLYDRVGSSPAPAAVAKPATVEQDLDPGALDAVFAAPLQALRGALARGDAAAPTEVTGLERVAGARVAGLARTVVDLMFDQVAADPLVPREFASLIAYLKLPVLRAALEDLSLLSSGFSAARRLVERLKASGVGWRSGDVESERLLRAARAAVQAVLDGQGTASAMAQALTGLEMFLTQSEEGLSDPAIRARRAFARSDEQEVLRINASIEIGRALQGAFVEPYLRDFLLRRWLAVLVAATIDPRVRPEAAAQFRQAVEQLVWSVQPKLESSERQQLARQLPQLLAVLTRGLELIEVPAAERREFFAQLMRTHSQAMQMALTSGSPPRSSTAPQPRQQSGGRNGLTSTGNGTGP
jgi:hypothetical protein